jgi:drug/metabolite transporter (DMT)-like permease
MILLAPALIAALAALAFGIGDFFSHRFAKRADALAVLLWICVTGTIVLAPWAVPRLATTAGSDLLLLGGLGVLGFFSGLTVYAAYKRAALSVADLLLQLELPLLIFLGVWLLGESLSITAVVAFGVLMVGLYNLIGARIAHLRARNGMLLAALGGVLLGIVDYLTAVGARATDAIVTNWVMSVVIAFLCALVLAAEGRLGHALRAAREKPKLMLATGLMDTLAWVLYAEALRRGTLSITGAIVQAYPLVAVFMGLRFGGERFSVRQWIGCALVVSAGFVLGTLA